VVDLSDVTFMDSTGIGVLLNAMTHFSARHGELVLVCPSQMILRPFELAGVAEHLKIVDSRAEALGALA
jgi:anti-sigma B factor antagonist